MLGDEREASSVGAFVPARCHHQMLFFSLEFLLGEENNYKDSPCPHAVVGSLEDGSVGASLPLSTLSGLSASRHRSVPAGCHSPIFSPGLDPKLTTFSN